MNTVFALIIHGMFKACVLACVACVHAFMRACVYVVSRILRKWVIFSRYTVNYFNCVGDKLYQS